MKTFGSEISRRTFIKGSLAAVGAGAVSTFPFGKAFGDDFPSRNMNIVIATGAGGAADKNARAFTGVWKKYFKTDFQFDFFAGAAGQVGYEVYLGKREPDAYNLMLGNMDAESIMYALQKPKYKFPGDYVYFNRVDVDPSVIWVRADSPFKTIEQMVAEAKKRTVTLSVSRLPHPACIGTLAMAEATGAKFNLIPYGGGNPTVVAALTGEVDGSALPMANPISVGEQARILCVFSPTNILPERSHNAPPVNSVFGMKLPDLTSARAFAIHTKAIEKYPDRYEKIKSTMRKVFDDPDYKVAIEKTGRPWEFVSFADEKECMESAKGVMELAERYRDLLTAKDKKK
jgi:tripartite-type tricarboxylate transporter receptor subunit TctC